MRNNRDIRCGRGWHGNKWELIKIIHSSDLTCTHSRRCRSSTVQRSWAFPHFHMSNRVQWSAFDALRRPCPYRGRRAARECSRRGRGQRTCEGPYCISAGCTAPTWQWVWYKRRHILCGASGTSRPRCKPWPHPDSDSQLSCQHQNLWMAVRWEGSIDIRGLIIAKWVK